MKRIGRLCFVFVNPIAFHAIQQCELLINWGFERGLSRSRCCLSCSRGSLSCSWGGLSRSLPCLSRSAIYSYLFAFNSSILSHLMLFSNVSYLLIVRLKGVCRVHLLVCRVRGEVCRVRYSDCRVQPFIVIYLHLIPVELL